MLHGEHRRAGGLRRDHQPLRDLLVRQAAREKAAGFTIARLEHMALPMVPKFVRPAIVGSAIAPALTASEPPRSDSGL